MIYIYISYIICSIVVCMYVYIYIYIITYCSMMLYVIIVCHSISLHYEKGVTPTLPHTEDLQTQIA